ncbi:MAG: FecR family protein [Leptospirales bacterium]
MPPIPGATRAPRLLLYCIVGLLSATLTESCGPSKKDYAVFQFVAGEVFILKNGEDARRLRAYPGATAGPQDVIETRGDSAAELRVREMGIIRMGENSRLKLGDLNSRGRLDVHLDHGRAGFLMKRLKANQEFRVATPTVIASVRGTSFLVGVDAGASESRPAAAEPLISKVAMFDGALELATPGSGVASEKDDGPAHRSPTILDRPGEVRLGAGDALSAASIEPLSAESIAEMKALEEMTSPAGRGRPDAGMIPSGGREILPRTNPLPLPDQ